MFLYPGFEKGVGVVMEKTLHGKQLQSFHKCYLLYKLVHGSTLFHMHLPLRVSERGLLFQVTKVLPSFKAPFCFQILQEDQQGGGSWPFIAQHSWDIGLQPAQMLSL